MDVPEITLLFSLTALVFAFILAKNASHDAEDHKKLRALYDELTKKHGELADLSRFKSELLSLVSHQMRSPLAAMKGFVSMAEDGTYGEMDPRAKEALRKALGSADDLIELVDTLLDLRQVEAGKMEYRFANVDISKLAEGVVARMRPLAERRGLALSFEAPSGGIFVNADEKKMGQVIQNLVDNAIKYTPGGSVKVSVVLEENAGAEGDAAVQIEDTGIGISTAALPHIFEEFVRDERVKKEIRGTGLGLFIAKKFMEAHGGTITVASEGEGKGSTFTVRLPLRK